MPIDWDRTAIAALAAIGAVSAFLWITGVVRDRKRARDDAPEQEASEPAPGSKGPGKLIQILAIVSTAFALLLAAHFLVPEGVTQTAIHELGFALLISVVVWSLFEAQLSQDADRAWDRRIDRVTKNVFNAVLRKDLPKELLDEANNLILNSPAVREDFTVTYTLRDDKIDGGKTDVVMVDAVVQHTMRNISTDKVTWQACIGLPNPIHEELKKRVAVTRLDVLKGGEQVQLDHEGAEAKFRESLKDNSQTDVMYDAGPVILERGESCEVSASYTMAKEAEDTEFLRSMVPADGLRVTVFDQSPGKRLVLAKSVHRHKLETVTKADEAGGAQIFKIRGYLLPQQGVLIWWKKAPASGTLAKGG